MNIRDKIAVFSVGKNNTTYEGNFFDIIEKEERKLVTREELDKMLDSYISLEYNLTMRHYVTEEICADIMAGFTKSEAEHLLDKIYKKYRRK